MNYVVMQLVNGIFSYAELTKNNNPKEYMTERQAQSKADSYNRKAKKNRQPLEVTVYFYVFNILQANNLYRSTNRSKPQQQSLFPF